MGYDAVLFDHDGVLVTMTSLDAHREGARAAFEAVGVTDPEQRHVEAMAIGVGPADLADVCGYYDVDPRAFWYHRDVETSRRQQAAMVAGEKVPYDDVDALVGLDTPLGVVSSNQRSTVTFSLSYFDVEERFDAVQARDPVVSSLRRKKPDPYYVERALNDLDAEDALFVGDSETDVVAARRAGVDAAFVRRSHRADAAFEADPDYEVDGLDDVVALLRE